MDIYEKDIKKGVISHLNADKLQTIPYTYKND